MQEQTFQNTLIMTNRKLYIYVHTYMYLCIYMNSINIELLFNHIKLFNNSAVTDFFKIFLFLTDEVGIL